VSLQACRIIAVPRKEADSNAGADKQIMVLDDEWGTNHGQHVIGSVLDPRRFAPLLNK